jgi:hypothetical protein
VAINGIRLLRNFDKVTPVFALPVLVVILDRAALLSKRYADKLGAYD